MTHTLHHLLAASAVSDTDRVALVDDRRCLTYAELDARSNQVANLLIALGVRRGDRVALYLEKSLESVVGIYGILKAGAAYVPLDAHAPVARLRYIAANCDVRVLVSEIKRQEAWAALRDDGSTFSHVIAVDDDAPEDPDNRFAVHGRDSIDVQPTSAPTVRSIDLDLAYILYTSGSTGEPKGVTLTHRNALAFVEWAVREYGVTAHDRLSNHAPLHFDLSVFDLFAAAHTGAAVVLVPSGASVFPIELARFIQRNEISIWYSVPSVLSMLTLRGGLNGADFPALRTVLFAGEVFPTKYLRQLMGLLPHVRFSNLYGPTETNVCTYYDVPPLPEDQTEAIPIGRAIANVEVVVRGADGRPVPRGEVGELWVRGATVMQGYWGDEARTRSVLLPNPLYPGLHDSVYRTGDLVQELDDGNLRFLGRRDAQVKSRGYRIELGEIEAALYAHPGVLECAVVAVPDDLVTNRIVAHVVAGDGVTPRELAAFCAERVPSYMVPERFTFADSLPRTSTEKVDRQALGTRRASADAAAHSR